MRKGLKILSTSLLLSTLVFAGCSCSKENGKNVSRIENSSDALLSGLTEDASKYTLLDVYNSLIASDAGNKVVANKLIEFVASEVLQIKETSSVWKTRYENLVKEEMEKVASSDTYLVSGVFSEEYMKESLEAEGYTITCPVGVDYGTPSNLACDYTDYINKNIKVNVLSTLLKEKYIQDVTMKERTNILTTKKIRDVEYFSVSSSLDSTYTDLNIRNFMRTIRDRIADNEVIDFDSIEEELHDKLKELIDIEYNKIGTSDDYTQSIAASYTNNYTQSKEVGYQKKIDTINNSEFSYDKVISSDSSNNAVISEKITSLLLSITDPTDTSFNRKVVAVTDTDDNTYYYLVSVNASAIVDASDVLISETTDSSNYTYSFVRFKVINSNTTNEDDIYRAVSLLAKESTLANGALSHYIKEQKGAISVYDDDVYTYLKNLYPDVFAD